MKAFLRLVAAVVLISLPTSRGAQQPPDRASMSARAKEIRALEASMTLLRRAIDIASDIVLAGRGSG